MIGDIQAISLTSSTERLTSEQQAMAQNVRIRTFFDELKQHCDKEPVVLLFDAYEKCANDLKSWVEGYLLDRHFFDLESRPAHLLLVLAGRELPDFRMYLSDADFQAVARVVKLGT